MNKETLRKVYMDKRKNMPYSEVCEKSALIEQKILNTDEYFRCGQIFTYVNMGCEVQTTGIIQRALADGKTVAVPVAIPGGSEMHFIQIDSLDGLKRSAFGVLEPDVATGKIIKSNDNTMALVPGLAFDLNKFRIGYGGGYYDCFLGNSIYGAAIGLAFDFQIAEKIETQPHDVCVDFVITDKRDF